MPVRAPARTPARARTSMRSTGAVQPTAGPPRGRTNPPSAAAVADSATSKVFLVAWKTGDLVGSCVAARVVDLLERQLAAAGHGRLVEQRGRTATTCAAWCTRRD